jgi:hypothetical protein
MPTRSERGRSLAATALVVFALSLAPRPVTKTASADNGLASITVYHAVCPAGYAGTSFFEDCYDSPGAGATFWLERRDWNQPGVIFDQRQTTTGEDGILAFEGIEQTGDYLLRPDIDLDRYHLGCIDDEGNRASPTGPHSGGFWLDLTPDDDLRCDWYSVPAPPRSGNAVLAYRVLTCPVDYSGEAHSSDCDRPFVGWTYYLHDPTVGNDPLGNAYQTGRMEFADGDGWAIFDGLAAGRHTVASNIPGHEMIDWRETCTGASGGETTLPVTLAAGDRAECTAYVTFGELSGGAFGNLIIESDRAGVPFVTTDLGDGDSVQVTTNSQGVSRFHLLPGHYAVRVADGHPDADPAVSCVIGDSPVPIWTSTTDADFSFVVEILRGTDIRCAWI